ncbi:hypothetical protein HY485_03425 [Candidatus Woesearchaeota archaeon]|nr:hypothetical protein [Candidatus Woesearchaeota archaeon]
MIEIIKIIVIVVNLLKGIPIMSTEYNAIETSVILIGIPNIVLSSDVRLKFNNMQYPGRIMYAKIANASENIPCQLVGVNIVPISAANARMLAVIINGFSSSLVIIFVHSYLF